MLSGIGASYCAPSGAFCVAWAAHVATRTLTLKVQARATGGVAIGFSQQYNVMAPADVYALWVDPSSGEAVLSHRYNEHGYDAPTLRPLPQGARVDFASVSPVNGLVKAQFVIPLPDAVAAAAAAAASPSAPAASGHRRALLSSAARPVGEVNFIWCTVPFAPFTPDGTLESHGPEAGVDFGAAAIDLLCTGAGTAACVRNVAPKSSFTILHAITLAGFGATIGAGTLATQARRRWFAVERIAQLTLARTKAARLARALGASSYGPPEMLLVSGYGITMSFYLRAALRLNPGSPGRAVGSLLAPALAATVLHVTRHTPWVPLLGVPFERAVAFHRYAGVAALAMMAAHVIMIVHERGFGILSQRTADEAGHGAAYGTATATAFAAMGLLATPPVRRRAWELFKAAHIALFPTALALSMLHAQLMVGFLVPSLIVYALDVALRVWHGATPYPVQNLQPLPLGAVRVTLATRGRVRVRPGQYAYLQLPGLSPAEWHPLSAVCHVGAPDTVSFLVLNGGRSALGARIRDLAAASPLDRAMWARLDGPYGGPSLQLRYYSTVLLVAGGVGIAPFVTLARALLDPRPGSQRQLRQATLLWSIRDQRAARAFVPGLLEELRASGVFRVRVHLTHEGQHYLGDDKHQNEPMRAQLLRAIAAQAAAAESAPELGDEANEEAAAFEADDAACEDGGDGDGDEQFVNGRADVAAAVREVVAAAAAAGEPACRVAVLVCGPPQMVDDVQDAASAAGCHFHAEKFIT